MTENYFCGCINGPNCLYITTVIDIDWCAYAVKNIAPIYVNNKHKINGFRQTRTNVAQTRSNICLHTSKWWWDIIYKVMVCAVLTFYTALVCVTSSMMLYSIFYGGRCCYNKSKLKQHTGQLLFDIGNAYYEWR